MRWTGGIQVRKRSYKRFALHSMCGGFTNFWKTILIDEGFINQVPIGNAGWPQPAGGGCPPFASQPFFAEDASKRGERRDARLF